MPETILHRMHCLLQKLKRFHVMPAVIARWMNPDGLKKLPMLILALSTALSWPWPALSAPMMFNTVLRAEF
jgi:hypothetical protein